MISLSMREIKNMELFTLPILFNPSGESPEDPCMVKKNGITRYLTC